MLKRKIGAGILALSLIGGAIGFTPDISDAATDARHCPAGYVVQYKKVGLWGLLGVKSKVCVKRSPGSSW